MRITTQVAHSQNEYSTIYFRNKNASGTLHSRMRIGGANGYISTNPIGDAAQASQPFEVQGGTSGNIFMGNNLAGYTVGQYPVIGTSGMTYIFKLVILIQVISLTTVALLTFLMKEKKKT